MPKIEVGVFFRADSHIEGGGVSKFRFIAIAFPPDPPPPHVSIYPQKAPNPIFMAISIRKATFEADFVLTLGLLACEIFLKSVCSPPIVAISYYIITIVD